MHSVSFVGCFPNNHPNGAGIGGLRGGERRVVNLRAGGWQIFEEKGGKSSRRRVANLRAIHITCWSESFYSLRRNRLFWLQKVR